MPNCCFYYFLCSSPQLTSIRSVTVHSYDNAEKMDIRLVLEVPAITAPVVTIVIYILRCLIHSDDVAENCSHVIAICSLPCQLSISFPHGEVGTEGCKSLW